MTSSGRYVSALFVIALVSMFVACGSSAPPPIAVSLTPSAAQTIDQAQTVSITATVHNDSKNAGVTWTLSGAGSLSNQTTTGATYNTPASVTTAFTATVTATSVSDTTKSATLQITVNPLPAVTTQSVAPATAGSSYTATINASGGTSPFTWSVSAGTLPAGLTLGSSTSNSVTISGTPTGQGSYPVTIKVVDATGASSSQALTITVNPPPTLTITTGSLGAGVTGTAYNQTLQATGGVTPYTWSISGSLPAGLTLNASTGAITGTPTGPQVGTISFTVQVTDSDSTSHNTATQPLSIAISAPPLSVTTQSLAGGTLGTAYSATLAATGGITPYSWSISANSLPAGLSLNASTGVISGTPTGNVTGPINFTVKVTDSEQPQASATAALSITITAPPLSITTSSLPVGVVGSTYSSTLAATGGVSPYTWSVPPGSLPPGLSLNTSTGAITGTPTTAATYPFTVTVTDSETPTAKTATANLSIVVNPALAVTTTSLPAAVVGTAYNQTLQATGGITPYSWSISANSLPAGLSLNSSTGAITGTPTGPVVGTISFTVTVADNENPVKTASANLSITVSAPPLSVTTQSLPGGTLGTAYSATLAAMGGITPYTWSIVGSLPAGLTLNASTGVISGTPTGSVTGQINFTVKVTDSEQPTPQTATAALSITISAAPLTVVTNSLPVGVDGSAYSATLQAAGGVSPYTWAVTNGSLPAGLTLNGNSGVISGTPTGSGTSFTVTVTDSETPTPQKASANLSITVNPQLQITTTTLANGVVATAYSQTLQATGGITPYTWSYTGTLPPGLGLNSSGQITGTPTSAGTFNFTAKVTDSETPAQSVTANLSITIYAQLVITTSGSLPTGVVNVTYPGATLQATGGVTPYTWSWSGNTPPGLSLSSSTGQITGTPSTAGTFNFTAKVVDSGNPQQTATSNLSITVNAPLTITTTSLPTGAPNVSYSATLMASGGITPYTWSITSGSLPNGLSLNGNTGVISGTPTTLGTFNFTVKVTDSEAPPQSATAGLSITITNTLKVITSALAQGVIGNLYSDTLAASGGTTPYTWSITVGSLPPGLALTPSTGQISGTPTQTGTFPFTVQVADSSSPQQTATANLSIIINPPLAITTQSLPNGDLNQSYSASVIATGGVAPYNWTITNGSLPPGLALNSTTGLISGTPTTTGTYPFTVTVTDQDSDSVSANYTVTIFTPAAAYIVSGNVTYSGSNTGQVYLQLSNNNCQGCDGNLGTSISEATLQSGGAFTIHGVPPGTYTLQAYMDNLGYGAENAANPTGSTSNITVSNQGVSGVPLALSDPGAVDLSGYAPSWRGSNGSGAFSGGAFVNFQTITNNGIELPSYYTVQWATNSSFSPVAGSTTFKATGGNNPWIVTGLTNGTTYYFRAQGAAADGSTSNWSGASPAFLIGAPPTGSGIYTVSGQVTFNATAKGPLYVGFYNQSTGAVYADVVGSKSDPPTSPASYSVNVPAGSNYYFFGFLDQNNSGMFAGAGQISNVNQGGNQPPVVISGNMTGEDLTLPVANSNATLTTQSSEQNGSIYYNLSFQIRGEVKLPVAVELATGPTGVIIPADMATNAFGGGSGGKFNYFPSTNGATPQVGDTYTLNVTYSDGTTDVLTVQVAVVLDAFATNLSPAPGATGVSVTPNFSWDDPANASNYTYQFWLCCDSQGTIWQIPSQNSNSNGFPYTITSITWDVDPTGSGDLPNESSLSGSSNYTWAITAQDVYGNSAQVQANFETAETPLTLQPAGGSVGSVTVGQSFSGAINASGGVPSYTFYVNGSQVPNNGQQVSLGNGSLYASNNGGNTLSLGGTPSSPGVVSFTVSVTDSQSNTAGPYTYTITVNTAQPLAVATSSLPGGNVGQVYYSYLQASGGVPPYTWSYSGSLPAGLSLGAQTGLISGTPTATGTSNFTVTVTDSTSVTATASLSISVLSCPNNSVLNGHYAFVASGWDDSGSNTGMSAAGSFVANGSGAISSGGLLDLADQSNNPGTKSGSITGGSYCVGTNNLATITLNLSGISGISTITVAAALDSADHNGHVISYDVNNIQVQVSGQILQQTTSAFSTSAIKGNYAFELVGADQGGSRFGMAGEFTSNGSGTLSGEVDYDDGGGGSGSTGNTTLSASDFDVASTGRGTASIFFAAPDATINFVFYVVSSSEVLMMALDSTETPPMIMAGKVLEQSGSFSQSSLDGISVLETQALDVNNSPATPDAQIGLLSFDGNGNFTVTQEDNDGGTVSSKSSSGTYTVTASTGRVTLGGTGNNPPVFYLIAKNQAFLIGSNTKVSFGMFNPQSGSGFTDASLSGNYYGGSQPPENSNTSEEVDSVNANGAGVFTVTTDNNNYCGTNCGGGPNGSNITVDYSVQSSGLVTLTCPADSSECTPAGAIVGYMYIISSSQAVFLPAQDNNPKLDDFHQ